MIDEEILKLDRTVQQFGLDIIKYNRKLKHLIMDGEMLNEVVKINSNFLRTLIFDLNSLPDKNYCKKYFTDKFNVNAPLLVQKLKQTIINYKKAAFTYNILNLIVIVKYDGKEYKEELTFAASY